MVSPVEVGVAGALLYYVFLALGSISAGYLILRFSYPEVRVFSPEERLGASALVGLVLAVVAVGADVLFSGLGMVIEAKGRPLLFWAAAGAGVFALLKFGVREKQPEVAIPVSGKLKTLLQELQNLEEKPPEKQSEMSRKLNELRKKGLIPRADVGEDLVKSITPKPPQAPPAAEPQKAQKEVPVVKVEQNVHEAMKVLQKAKETEIEAIISDLNIKFEKKELQKTSVTSGASPPADGRYPRRFRPQAAAPQVPQQTATVAGQQSPTAISAPSSESSAPKHPRRLYLQHAQAAAPPKKNETEKAHGSAAVKPQAEKPVTMEDLFGETKPATQKIGTEVTMVASTAAPENCPNCHVKNSRIVFCPYCGTGMCANCSPAVTPGPEGFTYQCPKCGEAIPVKKKTA